MKKYIYILIGLLFFAGVVWLIMTPGRAGGSNKYDGFAQCLTERGAIFYGAFWCPHCQDQKAEFSRSVKYVPYVECSTPDGKSQLQVCKDAGIVTYPTWQFNASTTDRILGKVEMSTLAEKTGCALPQ
ncbi:MAG: hypothetical protein A2566_02320 [Candidatus Zambryskibacteria bacterium RIFOXYD1_FULL_40_13]|nr:MAG: VKORC1/thioredoxin domain protein [Parcubacteria group bacterium GW2011_GWC1_39_12]KKR19049.1 MAG: VKORC1/thioredoxin domain protein [Parcubacteria group bacterium GW2011_GWF1_39_37]KKR35616.1 MAG: VKORC1/thioredoxin domain protein [Parcubacteria group bacterium GW2011_GWC2_40_10]KKR52027.1 MAG: VKORC1/thioredoxin domain protein [Parcubacteria group bacterium GW2011_GWE1_40_20]KKR65996.1 MAG: VKORC1/thioredoxin domain protein [Parcubacteria group bacterium GW2011_GWB1_40_5]KKR68781.1 M